MTTIVNEPRRLRRLEVAVVPVRYAPERFLEGWTLLEAADQRLQIALAVELAQVAAEIPQYRLTVLPALGPDATGARPDYRRLPGEFYDRVIEIAITRAGMRVPRQAPGAAVELEMTALVFFPPTGDAKPLGCGFTYRGEFRALEAWRDGGRAIADELDTAVAALAKRAAALLLPDQ